MGICIASWAIVEDFLFKICWSSPGGTDERAAIVFDCTPGFRRHLDLTDALVKTVLPKAESKSGGDDHPDLQQWSALCTDIRELAKIRNQIAHRPVASRLSGYPEQATRWLELFRSDHKRLRGKDDDPPLKLDDLKTHAGAVELIQRRLLAFAAQTLQRYVPIKA